MKNIYTYQFEDTKEFETAMDKYGWLIYEQVIPLDFIEEIKGFRQTFTSTISLHTGGCTKPDRANIGDDFDTNKK